MKYDLRPIPDTSPTAYRCPIIRYDMEFHTVTYTTALGYHEGDASDGSYKVNFRAEVTPMQGLQQHREAIPLNEGCGAVQ